MVKMQLEQKFKKYILEVALCLFFQFHYPLFEDYYYSEGIDIFDAIAFHICGAWARSIVIQNKEDFVKNIRTKRE